MKVSRHSVPVHDYHIVWPERDPGPTMYTTYKGRNFEGWISREKLEKLEADGVLTWDDNSNLTIHQNPPAKTDPAPKESYVFSAFGE